MDWLIIINEISFLIYRTLPFFNNLVVALLILFLGLIIGKITKQLINRLFLDFGVDKGLTKIFNKKMLLGKTFSIIILVIIYGISIFLALNVFNLVNYVLFFIGLLLLIMIFLWLLFTLIYFIPNVYSGLHIKNKFRIKEFGSVTKKGFLSTTMKKGEDIFIIPNKKLRSILQSLKR